MVRLVLWELETSAVTIEELRTYLREESVDAFAKVKGVRFKAWISDAERNRWGAVYLFDSAEAAQQVLPSRARELIGKAPDVVAVFDVEATTEGISEIERLSRLGLALE